ncbi:MAG: RagB/SusD family nutrient uptake outer membrane protein [Bacteroidales bacterium]|jgi:hypothetical protein|nr:RagB/SusD family nutrient uptake outer membrane protein [Bacteroidales bacterium]
MNKLKNILIVAVTTLGMASCGESFLKEELTTSLSTDYFDTPEGLKAMVAGLPQALRLQGTYEFSYAHFNYGTDEFSVGSDAANEPWNNYDARLQSRVSSSSNTVQPSVTWDNSYTSISTQNTVIAKAPQVLANDPELNDALGAAHFMRGWSYFFLVQQWGDVPLLTAPVEGLVREFTRAPRQEVVQLVIDDFQKAYDLLSNPATRVQGKIYKDAAAHFLAKALLYRQSEINSDFNAATKDADLSKALTLCDEVISHRPLATNFADLQDFTAPNGPSEELPENILSAQYTISTAGANGRYNKQMCLHYIAVYQNWTGMERDIAGGREYARLRTTNYAMDVYDRVNDSRFWKSYRTMQRLNYPSDRNGADFAASKVKLEIGQVGVMFIINDEADADRFEAQTGNGSDPSSVIYPGSTAGRQPPIVKMKDGLGVWDTVRCPVTNNIVPNVIPRYRRVRNIPSAPAYGYASMENSALPTPGTASTWPTLNKFLDGSRPDYSSDNSSRDFVCARVAETYLIAAEIKVRQGDYQGALSYINKIRERAAYKNGEDREKYVDGAQIYTNTTDPRRSTSFWGKNTYYISNNIPVTTAATNIAISSPSNLPAEDVAIINKLGYTSDFDKMLCLVLNERTRELAGEMQRWPDLARTKTLVKRAYAFNEDVAHSNTLVEYHYVRPIPQGFLDQIWKDGHALTAEEKNALQNPGYN